jgi:hypothetical protein
VVDPPPPPQVMPEPPVVEQPAVKPKQNRLKPVKRDKPTPPEQGSAQVTKQACNPETDFDGCRNR